MSWVLWGCVRCRAVHLSVEWWARVGHGCPQDPGRIGPDLTSPSGLPHWVLLAFGRRWLEADQRVRERRRRLLLEG